MLLKPCETMRIRNFKQKNQPKLSKNKTQNTSKPQFSSISNAQETATPHWCSLASHQQPHWRRRRRCYFGSVKRCGLEISNKRINQNSAKQNAKHVKITIQQHRKRTRPSSFTLVFTRIASATALAPSAPMLFRLCETMRIRHFKQKNQPKLSKTKRKTRENHNSVASQTHKVQLLHTGVHSHRIGNRPGAVVADFIVAL